MKNRVAVFLAFSALVLGLAPIFSNPASAQGQSQQSVAERCFDHHKFGAQPVDVAKTADGQTVLAQTIWNWHDAIGCYLTLDQQALADLQAAPPPQNLPNTPTSDSRQCFGHHKFGETPVDVAKTADGQDVLARLSWGYHDTIGCYLVLDDTALATLRTARTDTIGTEPVQPLGVPAPEDRAVLAEQQVGAAGAMVSHSQVSASVPAGAIGGQAEVTIREPLGKFGSEVGGEPVGVEHFESVREPVTVKWDVSHLSEVQQDSILLVRWDEELGDWLPGDASFEVAGGVLTAEIGRWSFWTWVANGSQTLQEIIGRRVDAPECSGGSLHDWVESVIDPDEEVNAAAIRLCYESGSGQAVTMRMANNRTFSQLVETDADGGWATVHPPGFEPSLVWLMNVAAQEIFSDDKKLLILPLQQVAVDIDRPSTVGFNSIQFWNRNTLAMIFVDLVYYTLAGLEIPGATDHPKLQAFLEVFFECGVQEVSSLAQSGGGVELATKVLEAIHTCVTQILDPDSVTGVKLRQALEKHVARADRALFELENNRHFRSFSNVLKLLVIADLITYFGDHVLASEDLRWAINGQGQARPLGAWQPTCTNTTTDSNLLFRNLAQQETFTGDRYGLDLYEFNAWKPSAEIAVIPLTACNASYRIALASQIDWNESPETLQVVRDQILALNDPSSNTGANRIISLSYPCTVRADGTLRCYSVFNQGVARTFYYGGEYAICFHRLDCSGLLSDQRFTSFTERCGIRVDGTIACAGGTVDQGSLDSSSLRKHPYFYMPSGTFTSIAYGPDSVYCAIGTDGAVSCWHFLQVTSGGHRKLLEPPRGQLFKEITPVDIGWCGITLDGTIDCWGIRHPDTSKMQGRYTTIIAAGRGICGIVIAGTIECSSGRNDGLPLEGLYTAITSAPPRIGGLCGIKTDGTIHCGDDAEVPDGQFTSIQSVRDFLCGLNADKTIDCWWWDRETGKLHMQGVPGGHFTEIELIEARFKFSEYGEYGCGLRTSGTIACWPLNYTGDYSPRFTSPPEGRFTSIVWTPGSADDSQQFVKLIDAWCGQRADNTVACWGNVHREIPDEIVLPFDPRTQEHGNFLQEAHNSRFLYGSPPCGLRADRTIACWWPPTEEIWDANTPPPETAYRATVIPEGQFKTFYRDCGQRTDGTIACVGRGTINQGSFVLGQFSEMVNDNCGRRTDDTIICWYVPSNRNVISQTAGPYTATVVTTYGHTGCGIRTDGTTDCLSGLEGQFSAIKLSSGFGCGLRTDQTIACWGDNAARPDGPPEGQFTAIATGDRFCGLRTDQTIACWGDNTARPVDLPEGQFTSIKLSSGFGCGLRTDQTIACWGDNTAGQADPPGGQFALFKLAADSGCGLRTNGTIACWGTRYQVYWP